MVHAISSWEESIFCHVNELSLKRWGMQRCPQLTRVSLCEPWTNLQVGRCATGNENRIDEELPGRVRHDFWPASIRNSCDCDGRRKKMEIKLKSSHCESSYDNAVDLLRAASRCCPLTWTHLKTIWHRSRWTLSFFVFTVFPIFIQLPSGCVSALERFIVIHFSHSHPVILPLFDGECWSSPAVQ